MSSEKGLFFLAATALEEAKTTKGLSRAFTLVPQKAGARHAILKALAAVVVGKISILPEMFSGLAWREKVLRKASWRLYKWATSHGKWNEWKAAGKAYDLADRIQPLRNQVVEANMAFAISESKKRYAKLRNMLPSDYFEDLVQESYIGLLEATEKYTPERGVKFLTYAGWWIRDAITKALKSVRDYVMLDFDDPLGDDENGLSRLDMIEAPPPPDKRDLEWYSDNPTIMKVLRKALKMISPKERVRLRNIYGIKIPGVTWEDVMQPSLIREGV